MRSEGPQIQAPRSVVYVRDWARRAPVRAFRLSLAGETLRRTTGEWEENSVRGELAEPQKGRSANYNRKALQSCPRDRTGLRY